MHQASWIRRRSSSPGLNKVWNHNTGYTGAAGIHSEVGCGAHARNSMAERRTSNVLTAEEEIMRKEIKKLQTRRNDMEKSMLLYSQKMRDISERKSISVCKSPIPSHATTSQKSKTTGNNQSIKMKVCPFPSSSIVPCINSNNSVHEPEFKDNCSTVSDNSSQITARIGESRMSFDSGIGSDSHCGSSRSSCQYSISDSEEYKSEHPADNSTSKDHKGEKSNSSVKGRARQRKASHDTKAFNVMTRNDKESVKNGDIQIKEFPYEHLQNGFDIPHLDLASIVESDEKLCEQKDNSCVDDSKVGKNFDKGVKSKKNKMRVACYGLFQPKVTRSPSLAALRQRTVRRVGPKNIYFKYSEEVFDALKGISNAPQQQKSDKSFQSSSPPTSSSPGKSPGKSPKLHGLDLEEVLEAHSLRSDGLFGLFIEEEDESEVSLKKDFTKLPKLNRERSFSAPSSKDYRQSFVSKIEQVDENDSILKSVLKKCDGNLTTRSNHSYEKKSVHFFLPDVFMKANVCTSQPADFR